MPLMVWIKYIYQGGDIEEGGPFTNTTLHYGFFTSWLGFEISSALISSTEYASAMDSLFTQTWFGPQFKHDKWVDIVMGDIESLSSYPHYWKSCLVPHIMIGSFDRPQGWNWHQAVFCHSDSGGRTNGKNSLLLWTPLEMLLHPSLYEEIPKQPWNPMSASVNPVTSAVPKSQPSQPDNPEARLYGSKAEVCP